MSFIQEFIISHGEAELLKWFREIPRAAGEDRVQAVCSEDEWLFCEIYDGFNGRDAADFLIPFMTLSYLILICYTGIWNQIP